MDIISLNIFNLSHFTHPPFKNLPMIASGEFVAEMPLLEFLPVDIVQRTVDSVVIPP